MKLSRIEDSQSYKTDVRPTQKDDGLTVDKTNLGEPSSSPCPISRK